MPSEEQVCVLYAGVRGYLDTIDSKDIGEFENRYLEHLRTKHSNVLETIRTEMQVSKKTDADIQTIIEEFLPVCGLQKTK
jgi:F0F1-type ATP synthase alpha subunit